MHVLIYFYGSDDWKEVNWIVGPFDSYNKALTAHRKLKKADKAGDFWAIEFMQSPTKALQPST